MSLRRVLPVLLGVALWSAAVTVPAVAQPGAPGELLAAEPTTVFAAPLVPAPVRAWALRYRSTSATDEPNQVSGTLLVPRAPWSGDGARPLVSYAIGTHGLADRCAPSAQLAEGTEQEFGLMSRALQQGWAVVVTDYEGLGTPGDHTYAVALSEGHAVLDAVRAAVRVPGADLSPDAPVGVWGYSQGGGAAAVAGELAPDYAPELDVRGVAAGGVPADLLAVAENLNGSPFAGLLVAATAGMDTAYPELGLFEQLNPRGQALVSEVREDCVAEIVAAAPGVRIEDLSTVPDPLHQPEVLARLADNGAGSLAPQAPVRVYHAQLDELIPLAVGRQLAADWCGLDVDVEYEELAAQTHVGGAIAGAPGTIEWLADRFAGEPAPSSC